MATVGFSVSDEQKQKVDAVAEAWIKDNGGSKSDFLKAMLNALELNQAKAALGGRVDEIEHVESLLDGLRTAYMSSLAMAKSARSEALQASAAEVDRLKSANDTLQTHLADLKAKLEASKADVINVRSDLTSLFQGQIKDAKSRADAMEAKAKEAESLKKENLELKEKLKVSEAEKADLVKANADHQAEIEQLKGRFAEKLEVALAKADNEKNAALLKVQQEAEAKLEGMRQKMRAELEAYATKLSELSSVSARQTK